MSRAHLSLWWPGLQVTQVMNCTSCRWPMQILQPCHARQPGNLGNSLSMNLAFCQQVDAWQQRQSWMIQSLTKAKLFQMQANQPRPASSESSCDLSGELPGPAGSICFHSPGTSCLLMFLGWNWFAPVRCARCMLHGLPPGIRQLMVAALPQVVLQVVHGVAAGNLVQALQAHSRDATNMQHLHGQAQCWSMLALFLHTIVDLSCRHAANPVGSTGANGNFRSECEESSAGMRRMEQTGTYPL